MVSQFVTYGVAEGLPVASVNDFLETSRGDYWVATNGGGMCRLNTIPGDEPVTRDIALYGLRTRRHARIQHASTGCMKIARAACGREPTADCFASFEQRDERSSSEWRWLSPIGRIVRCRSGPLPRSRKARCG